MKVSSLAHARHFNSVNLLLLIRSHESKDLIGEPFIGFDALKGPNAFSDDFQIAIYNLIVESCHIISS